MSSADIGGHGIALQARIEPRNRMLNTVFVQIGAKLVLLPYEQAAALRFALRPKATWEFIMPLPSQSARPTSRRSHMYSRRRNRGARRLLLVLTIGGLAVVAWWFWPASRTGESVAQNDRAVDNVNANAAHPASDTLVPRDALTEGPAASTDRTHEIDATRAPQQPPMAAATSMLVMGEPLPSTLTGESPDGLRIADSFEEHADAQAHDQSRETIAQPQPPATQARDEQQPRIPTGNSSIDRLIRDAMSKVQTQPIEARLTLSQALQSPQVSDAQRREIRATLTDLNDMLVFSPTIVPGDPFAIAYTVQSGDYLQKIVRTTSVQTDWRFAARINRVDPKRIRVGQRLKLITGPFHAVVDKSDFRLDLYLGDGAQQVFVCSLDVGLGQYNSTPEGLFRVKPKSKAINPAWVNPRTGEAFDAEDPTNPIGEYWIGLEGVDRALADVIGYGIHGTSEPNSIGQQASMGCVRLGDSDVELVYEVLVEEASLVRIVP